MTYKLILIPLPLEEMYFHHIHLHGCVQLTGTWNFDPSAPFQSVLWTPILYGLPINKYAQ